MIPYGGLDNGRVSVSGEPIRLKPQQALGFGLALHELATNAAKYGALSVPHGRLDISWRAFPDAAGQTLGILQRPPSEVPRCYRRLLSALA